MDYNKGVLIERIAISLAIFLGVLSFFLVVAWSINQSGVQHTERMQACVDSGKNWDYIRGTNQHQCVDTVYPEDDD